MNKKNLSLILLVLLISCNNNDNNRTSNDNGRIKAVTTIFPIYDFTRNIASNNADLQMIIKECKSQSQSRTGYQTIRLYAYIRNTHILSSGDSKQKEFVHIPIYEFPNWFKIVFPSLNSRINLFRCTY